MFKLLIKTKTGKKEVEVEEELYYYVRSLEASIMISLNEVNSIKTKLDKIIHEENEIIG